MIGKIAVVLGIVFLLFMGYYLVSSNETFIRTILPEKFEELIFPVGEKTDSGFTNITDTKYSYESISEEENVKTLIGKPQIEDGFVISKWDEESKFKVILPTATSPSSSLSNEKIEYSYEDYESKYYMLDNNTFEWELYLTEKPKSNVFTFDIETENLDFEYQAPLNEENITDPRIEGCNETSCWDEKSEEIIYRPFNVAGSYSAYHSSKTNNEYKNGKVFHLYKPYIYDSISGIWGNVSIENNQLIITVPQAFLDKASYPVTIDPSFGYTTKGGTEYIWDNSWGGGANIHDTYITTQNDTINTYSIWIKQENTKQNESIVAYNKIGGDPNTRVGDPYDFLNIITGGSGTLYTSTEVNHVLTAGEEYVIGWGNITASLNGKLFYDSETSAGSYSQKTSGCNETYIEDGTLNYRFSTWANYTEGSVCSDTCSPPNPLTTDYQFECSDNCTLSSNLEAKGYNITFNGTGQFILNANITNWTKLSFFGESVTDKCAIYGYTGWFNNILIFIKNALKIA